MIKGYVIRTHGLREKKRKEKNTEDTGSIW